MNTEYVNPESWRRNPAARLLIAVGLCFAMGAVAAMGDVAQSSPANDWRNLSLEELINIQVTSVSKMKLNCSRGWRHDGTQTSRS